jgi:hypothetical protein
MSGFSSTALWSWAEPMVETTPSPTRAMTVSSPAPPTSLSMLALTVMRLTAVSWMPSLATAVIFGVVMTLGLTLICTASKTFRPARSMAAARSKSRGMPARLALIKALITRLMLPPAR